MFVPLIFFVFVVIGVILFFALAGKKKSQGEDLGEHGRV